MTFMLSSVRDDNNNVTEQTGNKRKSSLSFLPSSPTKLKRLDRSHSRGSSLSLLSASSLTTSTLSRLSSFSNHKPSKRSGQLASLSSRKSPSTCTISLENVTVNICDEDRNLSKSCALPQTIREAPLETMDVNVIPFPSAPSHDYSEPQLSAGFSLGRRRRSNLLLLGHRRSVSVHSISNQHSKENPPFSSSRRQSTASKKSKLSAAGSTSPLTRSYTLKEIRFFALIRRSISHGIIRREQVGARDKMDVDNVESSGSVTFDILSDNDEDEPDENVDPCGGKLHVQDLTLHNQDVLLVERLSQILARWGYREREPVSPLPSHLRMPLAPITMSAAAISKPSLAVTVDLKHGSSMMMPVPSPAAGTIMLPELDGHATHVKFIVQNQDETMDVDRPERLERPTSPVARCLEPLKPSLSLSSPPLLDIHLQQPPIIVVPTPIPSPPPVAPGSLSAPQSILSPSQLVATLVLRHREKVTVRHGCHTQAGNGGGRRSSPLARVLYTEQLD